MKGTLKILSHSFLLGRFPFQFLQKILVSPPFFPPPFCFWKFCLSPTYFLLNPLQNTKSSLPSSETFKLLLRCQYGHIIVRRTHTKVIRCVKMFLLRTSIRNTKEHLSVPVSITKNFHCNLLFLF